jgi:pyruvoyl-dependent arginine decarboxylase (PvlArgDC)
LLTEGSFNLSAAIGIGLSKDTKSIGYYEEGEDYTDYYSLETRALPMVQLVLGWQLGK